MEMRMPDGAMVREEFDNMEAMMKRFGELSAKGGKVEKMHVPNPSVNDAASALRREYHKDTSKYGAHQGAKEVARRLRRLEAASR